jgi:predicted  nucleic acid-binding Zn-ribbon protein
MAADHDRTASLMTPAKLAQVKPKGPVSPAAWLDQMAADAGHQHLRRLAELRADLERRVPPGNFGDVSAALARLAQVLPRLDFGLLQSRGWWARTTGKARTAGAEFAKCFEEIDASARALAAQVQALQKSQGEQTGAERSWMEFEVEFHAIEKIIDQGARWLQDMRNQLKTRQAGASDAQSMQSIKDDAARCEILVERLKKLRAVTSAAQSAHQQGQEAAKRRTALVKQFQQAMGAQVKTWQNRLGGIAANAGEDGAPALNLEEPMESHRELQLWLKRAAADSTQLQTHEETAVQGLAALAEPLEAAR